jgi:hypothetical protein
VKDCAVVVTVRLATRVFVEICVSVSRYPVAAPLDDAAADHDTVPERPESVRLAAGREMPPGARLPTREGAVLATLESGMTAATATR